MLFRSLEKEVIFREDLERIFGKRPFDKEEEAKTKDEIESNDDNTLIEEGKGANQ